MKLTGLLLTALLLGGTLAHSQDPATPGGGTAALSRDQRAAVFLTKIRLADPDYRLILMACFKESELNLLLSRFVKAEEISILTKGLMAQLRNAFPGENLAVVAFRPVVPLREAATARWNGTTGALSYHEGALPPAMPSPPP